MDDGIDVTAGGDRSRHAGEPGPTDRREWLVGGGELGDLIRSTDWSTTPLGPREGWHASLRAVVNVVIACRFPMALLWGRERVLVYNDACREILGGKHPQALGRSAHESWPEVWHVDEPVLAAMADRGETVHREDVLFPVDRRGSLEDACFTICYSPVRVEDGSVGGTLVTLQERTAQLAERGRLLRERERALETFEHGDACVVLDAGFRVLLVNAEQERLSGTPRATSVGRVAWEVWPHVADARAKFWRELNRAMRDRVPVQFEEYDPVQATWLDLRVYPAADGGIAIFSQDVTARKKAEEALRLGERRLRAIFEDAAVGIVEVDTEDRFVAANARFCDMLGYSRDELLGKSLHEITAPEDAEITRDLNARGHAGELRVFDYEKRYLRSDGSRLWVHVNVSVVRDDTGRFLRAIGTAEDITERKRAEEALREANERLREADRRKDEFLGMLSHELRNPLAPIRNSLYILDHAEANGPHARRAKEVANRQLAHMTRLVDDLLDVTRIARGKIELRRAELDLATLARRTAEDHRPLMQDRHLSLAVEVPDRRVIVQGDETRLAQVLGNLLHNAAKFTPAGGRVTLAVGVEEGRAVVHVRDTGAGIASEVMPTIFEPFTQAKQTLARSEGGLGLGLALVKGLVALHGGDVAALSPGPGGGTDFVVSLPLAAPREAREGEQVVARGTGRRRGQRVLVIDDNRDAADSLAELVSMLGHTADVAYDGFAGLGKAAEHLPDVVLCDIGLPGMDGYEFARQLRALSSSRDVRLVAVSGYAQPEDVTRSFEAGFDAHVAKPPDPEKLAGLLG